MLKIRLWFFLIFSCSIVFAQNFTSSSEAFQSNIVQINPTTIAIQFKVANGYDLYQNKIKISNTINSDVILGKMQFPSAIAKHNLALGDYLVYSDDFEILVPIVKFANGNLVINITYQGCKANSFCYPAVNYTKTLKLTQDPSYIAQNTINISKNNSTTIDFSNITTNSAVQIKESNPHNNISDITSTLNHNNSNEIAQMFQSSYVLVILGFFIIGILISFTPCVFPMLPILLAIVVGKGLNLRRTTSLSISYVLGSACSYAIAGVIAAKFGSSLQNILQNIWVNSIIALLFVIFSLSLFGLFELQLPSFLRKLFTREMGKKHTLVGVFLTGAISTLILSPCVTAPLAGALLYIGSSGDVVLGGSALFAMGIGSGLPLLLVAVFGNKILPKNGEWMIHIKHLLGFIMLAMGVYLSSRFISNIWAYLLAAIWLISLGVFIFYTQSRKSRLFIMMRVIAIIIATSGIVVLGYSTYNLIYPAHTLKIKHISVKTIDELDSILQNAKQQNKPVILDYSASWCSSCREMELTTFANNKVIQLINQNFIFVNIDISDSTHLTKELMNRYNVFAPPTLVFINKDGVVENNNIIVGYISTKDILILIHKFDNI